MTKKAHCKKHKRFVPTCDPCKSAALKETVGFPGGLTPTEERITPLEEYTQPPEDGEPTITAPGPDAIPDYEPDEEEAPAGEVQTEPEGYAEGAPGPDFKPEGEEQPPDDPDAPLTEGAPGPDFDAARDKAEAEFDPVVDGGVSVEGEPNIPDGTPNLATQMSPIEMAMFMFPQRLIPEGEFEVAEADDGSKGYKIVTISYEERIQRAIAGWLEYGLTPEDAVIVVAAAVIQDEQLGGGPDVEVDEEDVEDAFEAGVEAAPEITGCIEDYNQGFNHGMDAVRGLLTGYYSGDEDAVAYAMMRWMEQQMKGMKK